MASLIFLIHVYTNIHLGYLPKLYKQVDTGIFLEKCIASELFVLSVESD